MKCVDLYSELTAIVVVSRMSEYDSRCRIKFPNVHYYIDEDIDTNMLFRVYKNEKYRAHQIKR